VLESPRMEMAEFIEARRPRWEQLEALLAQIHPPRLSVLFKVSFALAVGLGVYAYLGSDWMRGARQPEETGLDRHGAR